MPHPTRACCFRLLLKIAVSNGYSGPHLWLPVSPRVSDFVLRQHLTQTFYLTADEEDQGTIERVLEVYSDGCPVARSIKDSIEITSKLDFTPA